MACGQGDGGGAQIGKRRLLKHNSGSAAIGILKTLHPKRAIDSAAGSLPRRELPTGLRDGDGFYTQAVYIDTEYTQQNPSV